jgi:uncharacterized LabA/DUF88 family protein
LFIRLRLPVRDDSIRALVGHDLKFTGACGALQVSGYGQCCYIEDDVLNCGDVAALDKQEQENVYVQYITGIRAGYAMKKVAVFVDVQNVFYTVKEAFGCHFNYTAFWDEVTRDREVVQAFAYAIDRRDPKQMGFQQILRTIGFEVKLKPFIQRRDGSAKGDWDVGITLDMIELATDIDVAVLASGDGDFDLIVSKLRDKYDVDVEVYGARKLTAASLVQAATRFVPIEGRLLLSK